MIAICDYSVMFPTLSESKLTQVVYLAVLDPARKSLCTSRGGCCPFCKPELLLSTLGKLGSLPLTSTLPDLGRPLT